MDISLSVLLIALISGCADAPTESPDYNVRLNIVPADEPLYEKVHAGDLSVTADDMAAPFDSSIIIDPASAGTIAIELNLDPGIDRLFRIFLKSETAEVLYRATGGGDIIEDQVLEIDFIFRQSGSGTASSVKILRDQLPWDSHALDSVLYGSGLTVGTGGDQFYVYSSTEVANVELQPGIDLVIISNDQPQDFYDNLSLHQDLLDNFIRNGGMVLWCACDMGWNYGSILDAGLELPGGVQIEYSLDQANIVQGSDLELLRGLPDTLYGNYASQEVFSEIPYGAIVYMSDTNGNPTLIGYRLGYGWIIVTGQPLEYNYDRRDTYNIGNLLSRIVRFILGMDVEDILSHFPDGDCLSPASKSTFQLLTARSEGTPRW